MQSEDLMGYSLNVHIGKVNIESTNMRHLPQDGSQNTSGLGCPIQKNAPCSCMVMFFSFVEIF